MKLSRTMFLGALAGLLCLAASSVFAESPRVMIIEEFTSSTCPPCLPASQVMDRNVDRTRGIISVRYHQNYPNGGGDPFYLPEAMTRHNYYGVTGIPAARVNGTFAFNPQSEALLQNQASSILGQMSPVTISIELDETDPQDVQVTVKVHSDVALSNHFLHAVVCQRDVPVPDMEQRILDNGGVYHNGEVDFRDIFMKSLSGINGQIFSVDADGEQEFKFSFSNDFDGELWIENGFVCAFVQNGNTDEVLNAGTSEIKGYVVPQDVTITDIYSKIPAADASQKEFTITNRGDVEETFNVTITEGGNNITPNGWNMSVAPSSVTLAPGASETIAIIVDPSSNAGYAQIEIETVASQREEGIYPIPLTDMALGVLSDNSTIAQWFGLNTAQAYLIDSYTMLPEYNSVTALIPYNTDVINAFPFTDFDVSIFTMRGPSVPANVASMLDALESIVNAGKSAFVSADVAAAITWDDPSIDDAFYTEVLGVEVTSTPSRLNPNQTQVVPFNITGFDNDPVGDGINFTANQSGSNQNFIFFTDILRLTAGSPSTPIVYMDDIPSRIGGVRFEQGESRIVYYTFGMEAILQTEAINRRQLLQQSMDWLTGERTGGSPNVATDVDRLDFEPTTVNNSREMSVSFSNTGDAPLEISGATIDGDGSAGFSIVGETQMTIQPGQSANITVSFEPLEETNYTAALSVFTNVQGEGSQVVIPLNGSGLASSVRDVVVGSNDVLSLAAGPNPFVSETSLEYTLNGNVPQQLKLTVVNSAGQEVAVLHNQMTTPGTYDVSLSGVNLAAGTYYAKLTTPTSAVMQTIVLVK